MTSRTRRGMVTAAIAVALSALLATPLAAAPAQPAPPPVPPGSSSETAGGDTAARPGPAPATPGAGVGPQVATDDPAASAGLGVDERSSSRFVQQRANVPSGFTGPNSVGTDIAFQGRYAYVGNYEGFTIYDIINPQRPRIVSQVQCPGAQNDVSISGNLLYLSTDARMSDDSCSARPTGDFRNYWEGIKVFDVSNPAAPRYVKAVATKCGSHTHTLVPGTAQIDYLYVSSYSPNANLANCQPPHDLISIVEVPKAAPQNARVIAEPNLFPDGGNPGGDPTALPTVRSSATSGCHDITVYPSRNIAAGACMGDGIILDISNRVAPRVIERVRDTENFAFWHSATFNNAGTKVVFTDELGGGGAATCNAAVGPNRGANGIYDLTGTGDATTLTFRSYFKIPRMQGPTENCVAHNGSLIPVPGRDMMVQSWYQGGVSVWDFTDSSRPREIGYFERGPLDANRLVVGGSWSAYWYNGFVYSSDMVKGLDVLLVADPRTAPALGNRTNQFNPQTQPRY